LWFNSENFMEEIMDIPLINTAEEPQMAFWGEDSHMIITKKKTEKVENSQEIDKILTHYESIAKDIWIDYSYFQKTEETPVNFRQSMRQERHRWFPYKEGFSPFFVQSFINRFTDRIDVRILDTFSGVGTTPIQAGLMNYEGIGFDVNPLSSFVSKTKTINLTEFEQKEFCLIIEKFKKSNLTKIANKPLNKTVASYFTDENLSLLLKLKEFYQNIASPFQDLFKLAFLSIIEPLSTHRKDGNGVKKKTNILKIHKFQDETAFKNYVIQFLELFLSDLRGKPIKNNVEFHLKSSLEKESYEGLSFNCVLTSPPYANCFDYSKVYLSELWLGDFFVDEYSQKEFRQKSVRSHVHATWQDRFENKNGSELVNNFIFPYLKTKKLWSNKIPDMIKGYFKDMGQMLENIYPYLEKNSPVGLVVGNSVYDGLPIATDLILCEIGKNMGYEVDKIEVYRKLSASSQQLVKLKNNEYLRESLVVLRKK